MTKIVSEIQIRQPAAVVLYTLSQIAQGTSFRRVFVYAMPNWFATPLDRLCTRRRVAAESAEAMKRLKHALESP